MKLIELFETKLSFSDAKLFLQDIEQSKQRIVKLVQKHAWMKIHSQRQTQLSFGDQFSVFRGVTNFEEFQPEKIVSTSLDPKIAINILDNAPGIIMSNSGFLETESTFLRYNISPKNVIAWIPSLMEFVRLAVGNRTNQFVTDRFGERIKIQTIYKFLEENDEQEIIADVSGLVPDKITFGNSIAERDRFAAWKEWFKENKNAPFGQFSYASKQIQSKPIQKISVKINPAKPAF